MERLNHDESGGRTLALPPGLFSCRFLTGNFEHMKLAVQFAEPQPKTEHIAADDSKDDRKSGQHKLERIQGQRLKFM